MIQQSIDSEGLIFIMRLYMSICLIKIHQNNLNGKAIPIRHTCVFTAVYVGANVINTWPPSLDMNADFKLS